MPVQEYLGLKKKAKIEIDTLLFNLRESFLEAEKTAIGEDGLLNLESLANQESRDKFKKAFAGKLDDKINSYFNIDKEAKLDVFKEGRLWEAYAGFGRADFDLYVEESKDKMSYDSFMKGVEKPLTGVIQRISKATLTGLKASDKDQVISYLRHNPANQPAIPLIDTNRLDKIEYLADLIDENEDKGAISVKFLENKPYVKNPTERPTPRIWTPGQS